MDYSVVMALTSVTFLIILVIAILPRAGDSRRDAHHRGRH